MQNFSQTTRLAPSPTGGLHLGNARSLFLCWALARKLGWRVLLRSEDLDRERCDTDAEKAIFEELRWLGMDWDEAPTRQSERSEAYRNALAALETQGAIFACERSRKELQAAAEAAGAPHGSGTTVRSTPAMRPDDRARFQFLAGERNHRLVISEGTDVIHDQLLGTREFDVSELFGDPIIWTRNDAASYQFAVVVDDLQQQVTDVVRGDDLFPSAALQTRIATMLNGTPPNWWHLPLLLDANGRRLSKRDNDPTLGSLRASQVTAERIIGLIAKTCDVQSDLAPMSTVDFLAAFDPAHLRVWAQSTSAAGGDRLCHADLEWLLESKS